MQALTAYVADEIVECNMETQEADRLDAELARIRRALDPDDETYIRETVDDQLAMTATINRVRAVRDQWALNTLEPGQVRRLLDDLTAALNGPTTEG